MNKLKGSYFGKFIAWIIFIVSTTTAILSAVVVICDINNGSYSTSSIQTIATKTYKNINGIYSREIWDELDYANNNPSYYYDKEFRYGVIESNGSSEDFDFYDEDSYIETNFFMNNENLDFSSSNLYLYKVFCPTGDRYDTYDVESNGMYSSYNKATSEITTTSEDEDYSWDSMYADDICYDEVGGIFYYKAEGDYYPVQNIIFYFAGKAFNYTYDFTKEQYKLNYSSYNTDIKNLYDESLDTSSIEYRLSAKQNDGYFTFNTLYDYNFTCEMWGTILMDGIRSINGRDITKIYSTAISDSHFIKNAGYYLDEDLTLNVEQQVKSKTYWIFSLIPENVTADFYGNDYEQCVWLVSLFYELRIIALVLMLVCGVIAVLSLVYLINCAGYRKGSDEIHLVQFPDKMSFDLWSIIVVVVGSILLGLTAVTLSDVINMVSYGKTFYYANHALAIVTIVPTMGIMAMAALFLWYVLGIAVRVKNGKWWHNTICYKIYNFFKQIFVDFFQNISLMWKFIIIVAIVNIVRLFVFNSLNITNIYLQYKVILSVIIEKVVVYSIIVWIIIKFGELLKASRKLAEGDLSYKIDTDSLPYEFKEHGENLNKISEGMLKALEERMKSEHFKTELITNVSHDIKTPLTSIINYVDLLEKEELNNEKATEYIEVLDRQSSKLKTLIEDLVEASKASTGNLSVSFEKIDVGVFLTQTVGEFEEKLSSAGLELIINKPDEPIYIMADGRHLWRVVDNLMNNICKYAQPLSRVYVNLEADENVQIKFRNISKYQLNVTGEELMERFVRGDKSRNTEGHGLGLSIALSLVNLMGGKMEIVVDGDLFKVILSFKKEAPDMIEVSDKDKI